MDIIIRRGCDRRSRQLYNVRHAYIHSHLSSLVFSVVCLNPEAQSHYVNLRHGCSASLDCHGVLFLKRDGAKPPFEGRIRVNPSPDFYFTAASELRNDSDLSLVRECRNLGRIRSKFGSVDFMLVGVNPPIIGQAFGLGGVDIHRCAFMGRYSDSGMFPISEWPLRVNVYYSSEIRTIDPKRGRLSSMDRSILIAVGEIYRTIHEVKAAFPGISVEHLGRLR